MKRSWRWYLVWSTLVASLSMLLFTATAGPAHAWTQSLSSCSQPNAQGGCDGTITLCGDTSSFYCLLWQEPRNTSIHLYFFMGPSLSNITSVNFVSILSNAFSQYNGISAWNPFMHVWHQGDPTVGGSYAMQPTSFFGACNVCGATFYSSPGQMGPLKQGLNPARGVIEWYRFILYPPVFFNSDILWNTSGNWTASGCSIHADARKVAIHETGHAIGPGHTWKFVNGNPVPAIMRQGPVPFCTTTCVLQSDDIAGVQGIYPGNQQNS